MESTRICFRIMFVLSKHEIIHQLNENIYQYLPIYEYIFSILMYIWKSSIGSYFLTYWILITQVSFKHLKKQNLCMCICTLGFLWNSIILNDIIIGAEKTKIYSNWPHDQLGNSFLMKFTHSTHTQKLSTKSLWDLNFQYWLLS